MLCKRFAMSALLCLIAAVASSAERFQDLSITIRGEGRPVVLIHGLNSSAATWDELCDRFAREITCYQIQLPGFAGATPATTDHYLDTMRDQIVGFIRDRKLESPIIAGHSLGGVIALMIAIDQPALPAGLFVVDSLPFLPAAQNAGATAEEIKTMAALMRRNLQSASDEQYAQQMKFSVRTMARETDRIDTLVRWTTSSNRGTTADAIYALMTTDLRGAVGRIKVPTTVLASWAKSNPMAGSREATQRTFETQYSQLANARIVTTEDANHFIMWDDPQLTDRELTQLLATTKKHRP